jgi:hypothetical protein
MTPRAAPITTGDQTEQQINPQEPRNTNREGSQQVLISHRVRRIKLEHRLKILMGS